MKKKLGSYLNTTVLYLALLIVWSNGMKTKI